MSGQTLMQERTRAYQLIHDALARVHKDMKIIWVDSTLSGDANEWSGKRITSGLPTLEAGINKCVASRADLILVSPFHSETISSAAGAVLDVAGLRVMNALDFLNLQGIFGNLRPVITFSSSTAADIDIGASNIQLAGLEFVCDIASQVSMLDIDANADGLIIKNCVLREGSATGLLMISIAGAADKVKIQNCEFYATTAGNYDSAIKIGAAVDRLHIEDCIIRGDFDDACIHNPTGNVSTNMVFRRILARNSQSGQHAIELVSACTGFVEDVLCVTDSQSTAFDAGSLEIGKNVKWQSSTGGDVGSSDVFVQPDSTSNILGSNNNDNDYDSSSVVANADGSVLERLENLQEEFSGSGGIASFPSSAAPANNVSLAEVLRDLWDVVRNGTGGAEPASNKSIMDYQGVSETFFFPGLGYRVTTSTPTDIFDGTTDKALFTVANGKILLTAIWVETSGAAIDNTTSNLTFSTNPTVGTDAALTTNLDIDSDEVGSIYSIGVVGSATTGGSGGGATTISTPIIIDVGTICIDTSADAGTGGALGSAVMYYIPLESGASVSAAF